MFKGREIVIFWYFVSVIAHFNPCIKMQKTSLDKELDTPIPKIQFESIFTFSWLKIVTKSAPQNSFYLYYILIIYLIKKNNNKTKTCV